MSGGSALRHVERFFGMAELLMGSILINYGAIDVGGAQM